MKLKIIITIIGYFKNEKSITTFKRRGGKEGKRGGEE